MTEGVCNLFNQKNGMALFPYYCNIIWQWDGNMDTLYYS